jgi:telomerase protein component 1
MMATRTTTPVVIVIDALNQLDELYRAWALAWLPEELVAGGARLIVSTLAGRVLEVLQRRQVLRTHVGPLVQRDCAEIVLSILGRYGKRLEPRQLTCLLRKSDAYKPLYLMIACEELRVFGMFDKLAERIDALPETIPELLVEVLRRLEHDHGDEVVRAALSLIACSRGGVTQVELLSMLGRWVYQDDRDFDRAEWGRLARSLKEFLSKECSDDEHVPSATPASTLAAENKTKQITFFHEQLLIAVRKNYLDCSGAMDRDDDGHDGHDHDGHDHDGQHGSGGILQGNQRKLEAHQHIANYYHRLLDTRNGDYSYANRSVRAISELPYHLVKSRQWERLYQCLSDLGFIEAKCSAGMTYDLVADFLMIRNASVRESGLARGLNVDASTSALMLQELEQFVVFMQARSHILARRPELTFALANTLPADTAPALAAASRWNSLIEQRTHLRWLNKPSITDPCELTLDGHTMVVRSCDFSPNTRSNQAVSCADDCTLKVWSVSTGQELATLHGHSKSVLYCTYSPNGERIASCSWDKSIRLWNATSFREQTCLRAHRAPVLACAFSPKGNRLVSGGNDGTLLVCTNSQH